MNEKRTVGKLWFQTWRVMWEGNDAQVLVLDDKNLTPLETFVLALDRDRKRPAGKRWRWQFYRPASPRVVEGYARTRGEARLDACRVFEGQSELRIER